MTERDNDRHMLDQNSPHVQVFRFADGEVGDKPRAELREHLASAARASQATGIITSKTRLSDKASAFDARSMAFKAPLTTISTPKPA